MSSKINGTVYSPPRPPSTSPPRSSLGKRVHIPRVHVPGQIPISPIRSPRRIHVPGQISLSPLRSPGKTLSSHGQAEDMTPHSSPARRFRVRIIGNSPDQEKKLKTIKTQGAVGRFANRLVDALDEVNKMAEPIVGNKFLLDTSVYPEKSLALKEKARMVRKIQAAEYNSVSAQEGLVDSLWSAHKASMDDPFHPYYRGPAVARNLSVRDYGEPVARKLEHTAWKENCSGEQ